MMDGKAFNSLPPRERIDHVLEMARSVLGRDVVDSIWARTRPLVENLAGHGAPAGQRIPGDERDPRRNFWKGEWRVYDAD